jgi:hypothetical protein
VLARKEDSKTVQSCLQKQLLMIQCVQNTLLMRDVSFDFYFGRTREQEDYSVTCDSKMHVHSYIQRFAARLASVKITY